MFFLSFIFISSHVDLIKDELLAFIDDIGTRLEYFQELEQATRILNHPGDSLVLQTDFLYMVERVDICIQYFKEHVSPSVSYDQPPLLMITLETL
jgi:hypothetical protein